jgi:hypothetical protein
VPLLSDLDECLDLMEGDGDVGEGDEGLGDREGQRTKTSTITTNKNQSLHHERSTSERREKERERGEETERIGGMTQGKGWTTTGRRCSSDNAGQDTAQNKLRQCLMS